MSYRIPTISGKLFSGFWLALTSPPLWSSLHLAQGNFSHGTIRQSARRLVMLLPRRVNRSRMRSNLNLNILWMFVHSKPLEDESRYPTTSAQVIVVSTAHLRFWECCSDTLKTISITLDKNRYGMTKSQLDEKKKTNNQPKGRH